MTDLTIIKKALISEKARMLMGEGKYVFIVDEKATKNEIKKAVSQLYKVEVKKVNIVNERPKPKYYRGIMNLKNREKKAVVTLKSGYRIELGI